MTTSTVASTPQLTRKPKPWSAGCVLISGFFVKFSVYIRHISLKDMLSFFCFLLLGVERKFLVLY